MDKDIKNPVEIDETALDDANGGIGLLLPAVQKVREAAARVQPAAPGGAVQGDGSVRPGDIKG